MEAWEWADPDEWVEIQKGILEKLARGPRVIQQAIAQVLGVKTPPVVAQEMATGLKEQAKKLSLETLGASLIPGTAAWRRAQGMVPNVPGEGANLPQPLTELTAQKMQELGGYPLLQQLMEPVIPQLPKAVGKIPFVGPLAEPAVAGLTSPLGLATTAAWPGVTAGMVAGGVAGAAAGKGLEAAGVPTAEVGGMRVGPSGVLEAIGTLAGPAVLPSLERAAVRGAAALPGIAREAAPVMQRTVAEEWGGLKPRIPEPAAPRPVADIEADIAKLRAVTPRPGLEAATLTRITELERELAQAKGVTQVTPEAPRMRLTNDVRTPAEINRRMGQLSKVQKMTTRQQKEWNRLLAEKDLNELRATGSVDDQMDNLLADIKEMEQELELRAVRQEYKPARAPQFGTPERAEWEAARAGKPHGVRPTTRYSGEPIDIVRERLAVFREFADNMRIEPVPAGQPRVPGVAERPAEEPLVTRARFTETGEVIEEPTFATERELAGIREQQMGLGIGAGERPIETAGPMFEGAEAVAPEAVAPERAVPPTEPPQPPTKPPVTGEQPPILPERGYSGAQEILRTKEQTTLRPGKATKVPIVRQTVSALNPSVSMDRQVLVSYNAQRAARASLETLWAGRREPLITELEAAWRESPPKYIGPERWSGLKNTLADFGQNPQDYTNVSPRLQRAAQAYRQYQDAVLTEARTKYGVDIQPFPVKEGGFFVPNVASRESLEAVGEKVSTAYRSASVSSKFGTARRRLYPTAAERMGRDPTFVPETNIRTLADLHDVAVARMAGNETFKLGTGGKTLLEVMQETHPNLAKRMLALRQRLQSLRGTAGRLNDKLDKTIASFLENPDEMPLGDLIDGLDVRITRGKNVGKSPQAINAEIRATRQEIRNLRPAWEGANLDPYVRNRKTFRYYLPEQSAAIDKVLTTALPMGQSLVNAIDEIRITAFGGDFSPLTIQGLLGAAADPVTLAFNVHGVARELASGKALLELARTEPEMVQRYAIARGIPLGEMGPEFRLYARGPERVPGFGKAWALVNDRTMGAVEYLRYQAWKNDTNLLQKLNPGMSQQVADAEAINAWSKVMPALNPAERGASALQAQLERLPVVSTSFIGGPVAFIKDAASGLAKLGASRELSPIARWQGLAGREQLAVLRLTMMHGTLATLGVISYVASGYSPLEAAKLVLNPVGGRFLSISTGKEGYIPIGGPYRSLIRGMAPRYVDGKLVPFAGTLQFLRGKETPVFGAASDLIRNRDYLGRRIVKGDFPQNLLSGLWYAAENFAPLTGGAVSEKVRTGEATGWQKLATEAASQLGGVSWYERSPYDRLDALARKYDPQGRSWNELAPGEQKQLRDEHSDVATAWQDMQKQGLLRDTEWAKTAAQFETEDREFETQFAQALANPQGRTLRDLSDSMEEYLHQRAILSQERYASLDRDPRSDLQKLVDEYYAEDLPAVATPAQRDAYFQRQDEMLKAHPELAEEIERNQVLRWTDPAVRQFAQRRFQAAQVRSEYYNIPAFLDLSLEQGSQLNRILAEAQDRVTLGRAGSRKQALAQMYEEGRCPESLFLYAVYAERLRNPEREEFRRQHADELMMFYDISTEALELVGVR